jgi:hypothetical protein
MDATRLLEVQHDDLRALFEEWRGVADLDERLRIFEQLADAFVAHTHVEEQLFYPVLYVGDLKALLEEAVEQHLACKRIVADLLHLLPDDAAFEPKMRVLEEELEHHIREEQEELFPRARQLMDRDMLDTLGAEMERMYDDLVRAAPRNDVLGETEEAARLP